MPIRRENLQRNSVDASDIIFERTVKERLPLNFSGRRLSAFGDPCCSGRRRNIECRKTPSKHLPRTATRTAESKRRMLARQTAPAITANGLFLPLKSHNSSVAARFVSGLSDPQKGSFRTRGTGCINVYTRSPFTRRRASFDSLDSATLRS